MLEHRRQHYLSLLGIESYMPMRILQSAAPSLRLADELLVDPAAVVLTTPNQVLNSVDDRVVNIVADKEPVETTIASDSIVGQLSTDVVIAVNEPLDILDKGLDEEELKPVAHTSVSNPVVKLPQNDSNRLTPIKFIFSVWRVKDILILDTRKVREALPTDRLLQNILATVGYPAVQLPVSESLRWPLFVDKRSTGSKQLLSVDDYNSDKGQARAMVQAYVSAQHIKTPIKHLLLMGEEAAIFALDSTLDIDNAMGLMHTISEWEHINCFVMPSLYSMLQDPSAKSAAWQALQLMPVDNE